MTPLRLDSVEQVAGEAKQQDEEDRARYHPDRLEPVRLQAFCRTHLADFKVPKVILITSALPKNEMGKVERRELAARFSRQS